MKIYSMTATFGKLENQTLCLQPGLNVVSAPNEWGKSTWCAFLVNMLYGLETRVKVTKNNMPDKERYAPWSGSPMSGRIDLNWNGRDITIERWTKGRTPMGEFRAYETESGIDVSELTATTCGEMLLGVERSVFLRSGFLRLTDLPITEDDALRRRLNALVTTGDESGAADELAQKLKDLKNKCRSNRANGLIPQAEAEKAEIENKLRQLQELNDYSEQLTQRQQELELRLELLENHKIALEYAAGEENNRRIAAAQETATSAAQRMEQLRVQCAALPNPELTRQNLEKLLSLQQQQQSAQVEAQLLPQPPQPPSNPRFAYGLNGNMALNQVNTDIADYHACMAVPKKAFPLTWIAAALAAVIGAALLILKLPIPGILMLAASVGLLIFHSIQSGKAKTAHLANLARAEAIRTRYGGGDPKDWLGYANDYARQWAEYEAELTRFQQSRQQLEQRLTQINTAIMEATAGESLQGAMERWKKVMRTHEMLADAEKEHQRAASYAENMAAMAKPLQKPAMPDEMTLSAAETSRMLEETSRQLQLLQQRRGQYQGRMEAMGEEPVLRCQLDAVNARLDRLSETYAALELAQSTLAAATAQLQRRFAPRIAKEAQEILGRLTGGRYDRLSISQDMSLSAGTGEETVLRAAQRRSEGTIDQMYLALRLAVSRELTADAPFVLDDALVRFDDTRHAAAMEILEEEAQNRQIILFTCQSRETA